MCYYQIEYYPHLGNFIIALIGILNEVIIQKNNKCDNISILNIDKNIFFYDVIKIHNNNNYKKEKLNKKNIYNYDIHTAFSKGVFVPIEEKRKLGMHYILPLIKKENIIKTNQVEILYDMVLHIGIFNKKEENEPQQQELLFPYWQPPWKYYQHILNEEIKKNNRSKICVVYDDIDHPCLKKLMEEFPHLSYFQTNTDKGRFCLMNSKKMVAGIESFTIISFVLNPSLKKIILPKENNYIKQFPKNKEIKVEYCIFQNYIDLWRNTNRYEELILEKNIHFYKNEKNIDEIYLPTWLILKYMYKK